VCTVTTPTISSVMLCLHVLVCCSGNEGSVDKLLKQIGGFMSDIADDFKIVGGGGHPQPVPQVPGQAPQPHELPQQCASGGGRL